MSRRLCSVGGLGVRVWQYARTPAPLRIPTTPAPTTRRGAALRVLREVTLFQSLFKANKWIWLFGWAFHVALADGAAAPCPVFHSAGSVACRSVQPFGALAGVAMVAGLLMLFGRRIVVERIRYISGPSDYVMLMLLIAIGVSGLGLKFVARTDIVALKASSSG